MAGGRPATGSPKWSEERQRWEARVTRADGSAHPPIPMPGIPKEDAARARRVAQMMSDRIRGGGGGVPEASPETVNEWTVRWLASRTAKGLATVGHDKGRLANHVLPILGTLPIAHVTRDDVERVVESLDRKVRRAAEHPEHMAWKTAFNVWALVTRMFKDAVSSKTKSLRVRNDNPALDVAAPERGNTRAKAYLYPSEFLKLVHCDEIPIRFRVLYALAVYIFARAGELEALTPDDIDLEHGVISITKAVDRRTGEITSTKSGETRRIPIEPNLLPLLRAILSVPDQDRVVWLPWAQERAVGLREHLHMAGIKRLELHANDARSKHLTFHDLRSTGITWAAVRGDDPLKIMQRAGHSGFETTKVYIREAENLRQGFGEPFPALPEFLSVSVVSVENYAKKPGNLRREGDSNPWNPCEFT